METSDYIQNIINTLLSNHYEELSKKYHRCPCCIYDCCVSCLIGVVILSVIYLIVPVVWLILSSCIGISRSILIILMY